MKNTKTMLCAARPFFGHLEKLYQKMDAAYAKAARFVGFVCEGCADNCCKTWFYHHTFAEIAYLARAFEELSPQIRQQALENACLALDARKRHEPDSGPFFFLCPLNADGRCLVYEARPMICRLHGTAWKLGLPQGRWQQGPGCGEFEKVWQGRERGVLDRTPIYRDLAALEQALRRESGISQKIKASIAQLVAADFEI
ncbi:MAG: YkgJ family cysteine cluster protein [Desulfatibacillaceae bacterium]|nr:YkgJ family cysteine cluster protein [Desulfatibacillaceae bacterium]